MKTLINGNILPSEQPAIHFNDRGFLLGDGIFETIKVVNGHLSLFKQHYTRLKQSAEKIFIPLSYNESDLENMCLDLLKANNLDKDIAALRITVSRGLSARGIAITENSEPTICISASAYTPNPEFHPSAYIADIKRNEFSDLTKLKTTSYLESIMTRKIANDHGYDEGIMLNTKGAITETSIGNIFFIIDNKILTPRIEDGILPGIIRQTVIAKAKLLNIPISEIELMPEIISQVDSAFHTNSLIEIQALSKINDTRLQTSHSIIDKLVSKD